MVVNVSRVKFEIVEIRIDGIVAAIAQLHVAIAFGAAPAAAAIPALCASAAATRLTGAGAALCVNNVAREPTDTPMPRSGNIERLETRRVTISPSFGENPIALRREPVQLPGNFFVMLPPPANGWTNDNIGM